MGQGRDIRPGGRDRLGEFHEARDPAAAGPDEPCGEERDCRVGVGFVEHEPELLLEHVAALERLVELGDP